MGSLRAREACGGTFEARTAPVSGLNEDEGYEQQEHDEHFRDWHLGFGRDSRFRRK